MGGNKQKKSSFFSFFKVKSGHKDYSYSAGEDTRKVYPSDEDNTLRVVAEPGIDKKASAFIANFHATRVSEAIHHHQAGWKWGLPDMNPLLLYITLASKFTDFFFYRKLFRNY